MIECARCGYKNDAAAKFCAACGAPMTAPAGFSPALAQPPAPGWGQPVPHVAPAAPQWGPAPNLQAPPNLQGPPNLQAPANQQMPNLPPPQWGMPAGPGFSPPQPAWGTPAPQVPAPQVPAPQFPGPQFSPPQFPAQQPTPAGPSWGQPSPMPTPEAVPRAPAPDAALIVVPTTASAVMAPLEPEQLPPNAPRTLAGFLVNFDANPLGQYWVVYQGQNLVGRKGSGVELNLEIDHPTTSSRHATIHAVARPGRLKVEDLGSTNGTYVNERRLEPGERRLLQAGDTLRFGGFSVTVIAV